MFLLIYSLRNYFLFLFFSPQCMEEASVEGALIVQPINHKFDHSFVTRSASSLRINY